MHPTKQQLDYFQKLTLDREQNATILEKASMRGVKRSVVDKYSDQAHFIYELLQNADDAKATSARFVLRGDGLTFVHNGTVHFSISNPDTEEEDTAEGRLGHINAITSIANSNKNEATIGKFGVGFKAVFQYTGSPHIYDPSFQFKIERFIVPQLLPLKGTSVKEKKTVFYFPFDLREKPAPEAYQDIAEKLRSLSHPVLFLTHLQEVVWETKTEEGRYTKTIQATEQRHNITCRLMHLLSQKGHTTHKKTLWLFTRFLHDRVSETADHYSVGFSLTADGRLEPLIQPAFCFFPTKEVTHLRFIVHAPFLLTDSREGIKRGESWNVVLVRKLARLAADSLVVLKEIGMAQGKRLLDDNLFSIIPYNESDFSAAEGAALFLPFYEAIKEKLQSEALLPAKSVPYTSKPFAYWASDQGLTELISEAQLAALVNNAEARWVFPSLGRKQVLGEKTNHVAVKANYIDTLVKEALDPEKILKKFTPAFIEQQPTEWLKELYAYLLRNPSYQEYVRYKPIFLNAQGKATAAYDEEKRHLIFLPSDTDAPYETVHSAFLDHSDSMALFKAFGIEKPQLRDEVNHYILPLFHNHYPELYRNGFSAEDAGSLKRNFIKLLTYFKECQYSDHTDYINRLKKIPFLVCQSKATAGVGFFSKPAFCYNPTIDLLIFFEDSPTTAFVDEGFYGAFLPPEYLDLFSNLLSKVGVGDYPKVYCLEVKPEAQRTLQLANWSALSEVVDKQLAGCSALLHNITDKKSLVLWWLLCARIKTLGYNGFKEEIQGEHVYYFRRKRQKEFFLSSEYRRLVSSRWLLTKSSTFVAPPSADVSELLEFYETESREAKELITFFGHPQQGGEP